MSDVALIYKNLRFDVSVELGDLESDEGFETAVSISLFTDARVLPEELPRGETELRGWWGNEFNAIAGDQVGSKLWLLDRSKISEDTRNKAEEYAREALQWFLDDGIAEEVNVKAVLVNQSARIDLEISIKRPKIKDLYYYRFQLTWDGQLQARKV